MRKGLYVVLLIFTVILTLGSCKKNKNKSKGGDSTQVANNIDSTASQKEEPFDVSFENQKNVMISMHIPGGAAEIGSFDFNNGGADEMNSFDIESNNILRKIDVESFYMDETEVANIHWLEYLYYLQNDSTEDIYTRALPDTTVWARELAFNDFYVQSYLRYPAFRFYPVVGVNWLQANDYCLWRTAKVNEYLSNSGLMNLNIGNEEIDSTSAISNNPKDSGKTNASKKKKKKKKKKQKGFGEVTYRLPSEAEWEYAAQAAIDNQFKDESERHKRIYPWDGNTVRSNDKKYQGNFLANFKRGRGDYSGIIKSRRTDGAMTTAYIWQYPPNDFGLYNMAGNVNEWIYDEFVPLSYEGEVVMEDEETGFLEGSGSQYNKAGFSMNVVQKNRVYKGGSWDDVAYWLSPGTRRFLSQDSSTSTIGIRCAMTMAGMSTGKKQKENKVIDEDEENVNKKSKYKYEENDFSEENDEKEEDYFNSTPKTNDIWNEDNTDDDDDEDSDQIDIEDNTDNTDSNNIPSNNNDDNPNAPAINNENKTEESDEIELDWGDD